MTDHDLDEYNRDLDAQAELSRRKDEGELDNCEICHGARGWVRGNENRIKGQIVCDYCHADMIKAIGKLAEYFGCGGDGQTTIENVTERLR